MIPSKPYTVRQTIGSAFRTVYALDPVLVPSLVPYSVHGESLIKPFWKIDCAVYIFSPPGSLMNHCCLLSNHARNPFCAWGTEMQEKAALVPHRGWLAIASYGCHFSSWREQDTTENSNRTQPSSSVNNRQNPYLFRNMLLKMLEAEHVEYKKVTEKAA